MPSDEQDNNIPATPQWPSFESIYRSIVQLIEATPEDQQFPKLKLKNRLINVGLKELLDGIEDGQDRQWVLEQYGLPRSGRALEVYGLPFKYITQWDEAALTLAHFLSRFRDEEGSSLDVYALHRLSKGEDKTLSDWQTAKAKLYIELQNMILLLDGVGGRTATIKRIFAFSKIADIAFLTQSAVSLLSEQMAAGIKVGFLFTGTFKSDPPIGPISNGLIVNFKAGTGGDNKHLFNFYAMSELLDDRKGHDLPYQERCTTKWFRNSAQAFESWPHIKNVISIFDRWTKPNYKNPTDVYRLEGPEDPSDNQVFNSTTVTMAKTFDEYGGANFQDFVYRMTETVITNDWIRLQRAISAFDDPSILEIKAVDATSVKNSLTIHESDPTYRNWLRKSLSRVLKSPDKSLKRIYILDDSKEKASSEFATLLREMQYYLDYYRYDISEMFHVLWPDNSEAPASKSSSATNGSLEYNWRSFKERIQIYVTTSTILKEFAQAKLNTDTYRDMLHELIPGGEPPSESLMKLDYLYAKGEQGIIYNFVNQRADPGELKFRAYLYRNSFNVGHEQTILFDSLDDIDRDEQIDESTLTKLKTRILRHRTNALARSIGQYDRAHNLILPKVLPDYDNYKDRIESIKNKLNNNEALDPDELLKIRGMVEPKLYKYVETRFSYLYDLLEYLSLKVEFFSEPRKRLIQEISPFVECGSAETLTKKIRGGLDAKAEPPPEFSEEGGRDAVTRLNK
jgi:hypothetical protein